MRLRTRSGADNIIFVTGTGTGVGKTLLTGLLLHHLRHSGVHALAIKPFCSGNRADVELLTRLQDDELERDEVNPYFFEEPVAPLVALRERGRNVSCDQVIQAIRRTAARCDVLFVEGVGGVMVPLGEGFLVLDLIRRLRCRVVVVSRNQLGTLNHTLLTLSTLLRSAIRRIKTVMMQRRTPDISSRSNVLIMSRLLPRVPIFLLPYLGSGASRVPEFVRNAKKVKKTLAQVLW